MLFNLWPGDFMTRLKVINQNLDEENGKASNKGNVRYRKVHQFSSNKFWKNIGCLVSAPTFGLGGSRLWEKEEGINLILKKSKRRSIRINVDLYEFCISYIIYCLLFYFKTILIPFFSSDFWYLSH